LGYPHLRQRWRIQHSGLAPVGYFYLVAVNPANPDTIVVITFPQGYAVNHRHAALAAKQDRAQLDIPWRYVLYRRRAGIWGPSRVLQGMGPGTCEQGQHHRQPENC